MHNRTILDLKIFRISAIIAIFFTSLGFSARAEGSEKAKTKFDPKEIILEHVGDSHSWHLFGHTAIHLPVILYTDKGLECFSSSVFGHGDESFAGKHYTYKLFNDKLRVVDSQGAINAVATKNVWDFSITKNVASMWISMILLVLIFLSVSSAYRKRLGKSPKGLQSFIEPVIVFIRDDVGIPNIGAKYQRYMPLLLTMFFFILINNLMGLVPVFPGGSNVTGNIAITITLSVITLLVVNFSGNKYYWKHIFAPNVPFWLWPIMVLVEVIGIVSKPFALMIRLFANITAGHIVVLSLISLIFIFDTIWMSPVSVLFVVFMDVIEILVAFLQAYIFTMLSALFIGMAVEEAHH